MKRVPSMAFCILLLATLCGCGKAAGTEQTPAAPSSVAEPTASVTPAAPPSTVPASAEEYFPILLNVRYVYEGQGIEFAAYDVYIDYASDTAVQQRVGNGGTVVARVVKAENGKVTCLLNREESYFRENFLNKTGKTAEVLLMEPITAGTTWTVYDGRTRTITDTASEVETPSGTYTAVAVETAFDGGTTTQYYAKGVGLVKTVTNGDGYEISSTLSEIQEDVPFKQTVRFYYPDGDDGKIYYRDTDVSFKTNDVTRSLLETAYKAPFSGRPGSVLSENTVINSLYLNDDGMVYIDLSKAFLTEMNAGSVYESMLLQCVANTFGAYYGAERVILTIDGGLYESGHIALRKGEYLTVNTEGAAQIP